MRKILIISIVLLSVFLIPMATAGKPTRTTIPVTFTDDIDGTILEARVDESSRSFHLRANYEHDEEDEIITFSEVFGLYAGDYQGRDIEVSLNLRKNTASFYYAWSEDDESFRLGGSGTVSGASGEFAIVLTSATIWNVDRSRRGKDKYDPVWTLESGEILFVITY